MTFKTMKKVKLFLITMLILAGPQLFSQSFQITPYSGYTFNNRFYIEGGRAEISGGHTFGGIVTYSLPKNFSLEFLYSRHMTTVSAWSTILPDDVSYGAAYNYFLIGANRNVFIPNTGLKFYGGTKIGASVLSAIDNEFETKTNFAVSLGVGSVFMFTENLGLHLGANVKAPILDPKLNLWWGLGSGPQVGMSSWTPIVQFNLLGGVVFSFGQ